MKITFEMDKLNNPTLTAANVYVTFAAVSSDIVYASGLPQEELINFSQGQITIDSNPYSTSRAYSFEEILNNGLTLNSAVSLVGFISYGTATGIELLTQGQPNFLSPLTPRYSIFELSYPGTADITNISQYGGSIQFEALSNGIVQSQTENTLDTTSMFNALANVLGFSGTESTAAVYVDENGKFIRVIGPNVFPNGSQQNPYPMFNAYLQYLFNTYGTNSSIVKELTNLAPGQPPGGQGAAGYISTSAAQNVSPNTLYNLDYHFTALVTQITPPSPPENPNGTYQVVLQGYVNATLPNSTNPTYTYENLSIEIAADGLVNQNFYMTNFIYQEAITREGITFSGWDDFNNDFNAPLSSQVAGDFAEGMNCGFVGSTIDSQSSPTTSLGNLTSYEWWQNPQLAYKPAQPDNPYYNTYGNVVYSNSAGTVNKPFPRGGVYGSPYDDRFNLNSIPLNDQTDEMRIVLLADDNLNPKFASKPLPKTS